MSQNIYVFITLCVILRSLYCFKVAYKTWAVEFFERHNIEAMKVTLKNGLFV